MATIAELAGLQRPGTGYRSDYRGEDNPDPYGEGAFFEGAMGAGYVPLSNELGGSEKAIQAVPTQETLNYYNQTYGTGFRNVTDYYRFLYNQPTAEVVDTQWGPMLKVGVGAQPVNQLEYNPNPGEEFKKFALASAAAFGGAAGLAGLGALGAGGGAAGTGAGAAGIAAGEVGAGGGFLGAGGAYTGAAGAGMSAADLAGYWNPAAYGAETGVGSGYGAGGELYGPLIDNSATGAFDMGGAAGSGIPGSGAASSPSYASIYGPAGSGGFLDSAGSALSKLFGGGTGAGGAGGAGGGGILDSLSKLFPGANLGSLLTGLGQAGLGYLGAKEQTDAMREMQQKWLDLGAPSRARWEGSFAPGFDIFSADPAAQGAATSAADIAARSYSAKSGNPFDQPAAQGGIYRDVLSQVALPQLNTYRSQNLTGGQLGLNTAGTASIQGANLAGSGLDAIGAGLSTALNPPPNYNQMYADMMKNYKITTGS